MWQWKWWICWFRWGWLMIYSWFELIMITMKISLGITPSSKHSDINVFLMYCTVASESITILPITTTLDLLPTAKTHQTDFTNPNNLTNNANRKLLQQGCHYDFEGNCFCWKDSWFLRSATYERKVLRILMDCVGIGNEEHGYVDVH